MRSSLKHHDDKAFSETDWEEVEMERNTDDLAAPARSPIEEAFYESYIIQSRTTVDNLYASNVLSCQKHTKEVADLARQRKVKLSTLEREQKRLVKKMEELKFKQEAVGLTKRTKEQANNLGTKRSPSTHKTETPGKENPGYDILGLKVSPESKTLRMETRRGSLPPLVKGKATADINNESQVLGLVVHERIQSKSCNDLTTLQQNTSSSSGCKGVLPAIHQDMKSSTSLENVSVLPESPFVTHLSPQVHKDPNNNKSLSASREPPTTRTQGIRPRPKSWNESQFKSEISTKVKWVPRS